MNTLVVGLVYKCKRAFLAYLGEHYLLTTFWPNDYRLHQEHRITGRHYRITRHVRATDTRFFEVWGRENQPASHVLPRQQVIPSEGALSR